MRFTDYRTFKTAIGGKLLQLEIGKVCEMANGQVMADMEILSSTLRQWPPRSLGLISIFSRCHVILKRKRMPPGRFREALSRGKDVPAKKLSLIQG